MEGQGLDGERLRAARENAGFTLRSAAEAIGISHGYISQLENAFKDPGVIRVLVALANLYGVSVDYLVGRSSDMGRRSQVDENLPLEFRMALQLQRDAMRVLSDESVRVAMLEYMLQHGGDWMGFLAGVESTIVAELREKYETTVSVLQDAELGVSVEQ